MRSRLDGARSVLEVPQIFGLGMLDIPEVFRGPMAQVLGVPRCPGIICAWAVIGQWTGIKKARADGFAESKTAQRGLVAVVPLADNVRLVTRHLHRLTQERVIAAMISAASP